MVTVLIILLLILVLYVLSTVCRKGQKGVEALYGWSYAHRGLHGDGVPENSMEAFRRAREHNYGVELDVHLLADGEIAVIHDSELIRTTGKEGRIEDLTLGNLQDYYLENTMQTIPSFAQVLQLFDGRVPLIVELKAVGGNHAQLCEKVCKMLDHYKGVYCLESFDPRCVFWLRKNRPELIRGQLTENFLKNKKSKLSWIFKFLLTNQMLNFLTLPDFVAFQYCDRKVLSNRIVDSVWHVPSVVWTLKNKREWDTSVKEGRIPIFENFLP